MGFFSENLDLRWGKSQNKIIWTLLAPYSYTSDAGEIYTAPAGFQTDLATIPQPFWSLLPPFWKYAKAAVIHDYMLSEMKVDYVVANKIFDEGMGALNVNRTQRFFLNNGVKLHFFIKNLKKKFIK